jgi:hypothetical protein
LALKTCPGCKQSFSHTTEFFNRDRSKKSGLSCYCRDCTKARSRKYHAANSTRRAEWKRRWRVENPEQYHENNKRYYHESPGRHVFNEWRARGCAVCGTDDIRVIQAHHLDPSQKDRDHTRVKRPDLMAAALAKCVPLCANHHFILHDELRKNPSETSEQIIERLKGTLS